MDTETSAGEILLIATSWFLSQKKHVRVEINQKSVTEMAICASPQSIRRGNLEGIKLKTKVLSLFSLCEKVLENARLL